MQSPGAPKTGVRQPPFLILEETEARESVVFMWLQSKVALGLERLSWSSGTFLEVSHGHSDGISVPKSRSGRRSTLFAMAEKPQPW